MLSKMELLNKRKPILVAGLILIIISGLFHFVIQKNYWNKIQNDPISTKVIEKLITQADSSLGYAPHLAEQITNSALKIALRENQAKYIIQCWMILGKIQNIKGENTKALELFTKAYQLAQKKYLPEELCIAKIKIGEIIYDHGNYDSALIFFQDAEKIAYDHHLEKPESYALSYIGKYNETKGNFQKAKEYYNRALEISRRNKDYKQLILLLPSRGKNYISDGKLDLALECYIEAFQLSEQLNDQLLYAETSSHLGSIYLQMKLYDKALMYDKKALSLRSSMNNPEGRAKSYNNIGKAYYELNQPDSAFYYFNQSLGLCKSIGYKKGMVKALNNIGKIYSGQNKNDQALAFLTEALTLSNQAGYDAGIAEASLSLANMYKSSHQINKAKDYYQLSLTKVGKTNYDEIIENIYKGLFECDSSNGNYKSALQYHIALLETEKRLLNVENNRQLAILNISFDSERKEKDNQVLRADNELKELLIKRRTTFIWLIAIVLVFTITLCISIYKRFYAKKKANQLLETLNFQVTHQNTRLEILNKELEKANQEKDKLFSIISHELRNPLYWFQNLAEFLSKRYKEMPPDKVQKSLSALDESAKNAFHLMDNLLQWSRSKLNRIHPKKSAKSLFELIFDTAEMFQTIIQHKEINYYNNIPDNITIYADPDLFCCIIRNLISNAIKYTPEKGTITIECHHTGELVTIIVSDSGNGIPDTIVKRIFTGNQDSLSTPGLMQEKGSGLGLKLCKDFAELNGGNIWVKSIEGSGTQFFFTVPEFMVQSGKLEMNKKIAINEQDS